MMRYFLLLLLLSGTAVFSQKQKAEYFIYTKDWDAAKDIASADYVVQSTNIGDSLFINRIYKGTRYLWKQESFSDADKTMPHGLFAWYDDEGRVDSTGYVSKMKKSGHWSYYDDTLGVYLSVQYDNGKETERRDYTTKLITTLEGVKTFDQEKKEKESTKADTAFKDEKEATFNGGPKAYKKYLEKNLEPPTNLFKTGPVKVQFIINKVGKIENLLILRSLQLTADIEALRVLSEMPDWTPAYQNGKNVIYQCIQWLTFQVN